MFVDAELRNTGLERSEKLAKDLEWFEDQKRSIPEPSARGHSHARYLEQLSDKDPQAFICHFYNVYFAHSAGGPIIGRMVQNFDFCLNIICSTDDILKSLRLLQDFSTDEIRVIIC